MLRNLRLLAVVASVAAHGSGAWKDPKHFVSDDSLAGMRYVSEDTHVLTMVGSDDGKAWWSLKGWCTGDDMTTIHFDFSPKGGPKGLAGKYARGEDGKVTLTWPDGNAWELMAETADSGFVKAPKKACCNCECGVTGQCGAACSSCDCEGCCAHPSPPPAKPKCNCGCGAGGPEAAQCGTGCYECDCEGCA